jgi:transposase
MCSFNKRNCIVDKSLKIIKLIKNAVRLILDSFGIVGFLVFGRMPVDLSHFSPHFDSILSSKYFILKALKRKRVPKNFEQFQTCDFPHILRKLTKNRRLVNFFEEIRFYWQTQFDCLHKYHFYIKSMQDSTKNSKYTKRIYRSV